MVPGPHLLMIYARGQLLLASSLGILAITIGIGGALVECTLPEPGFFFGPSTVNMREGLRRPTATLRSKPLYPGPHQRIPILHVPTTKSLFSELPESLADLNRNINNNNVLNLGLGLGSAGGLPKSPRAAAGSLSDKNSIGSVSEHEDELAMEEENERDDYKGFQIGSEKSFGGLNEDSLILTLGLSGINEYFQKQKMAQKSSVENGASGTGKRLRSYRKRPRSEIPSSSSPVELLAERVQNLSIQ